MLLHVVRLRLRLVFHLMFSVSLQVTGGSADCDTPLFKAPRHCDPLSSAQEGRRCATPDQSGIDSLGSMSSPSQLAIPFS